MEFNKFDLFIWGFNVIFGAFTLGFYLCVLVNKISEARIFYFLLLLVLYSVFVYLFLLIHKRMVIDNYEKSTK